VIHASPKFTGRDFPHTGIDPDLPIPATLAGGGRLEDVRLAIIGEALGEQEEKAQAPFVGPTGTTLRALARQAGLAAVEHGQFQGRRFYDLPGVYIDNVVKQHPEGDDLNALPAGALDFWQGVLARQLASGRFAGLNCILAVGATAMRALCPRAADSVTKWRGSVVECTLPLAGGRRVKVIPTLHPSFLHKMRFAKWHLRYQVISDLQTALAESETAELSKPKRSYIIFPSVSEMEDYADHVVAVGEAHAPDLAAHTITEKYPGDVYLGAEPPVSLFYDYETHPPFPRSIAFALNSREAICFPLTHANLEDYWSPEDEVRVWRAVARVLGTPIPKGGANCFTYDAYYDGWHGMPPKAMWGDIQYMHKALQPELPVSLAVLCSLYTQPRQQFYKDEGKSDHAAFSERQFFEYNCTDCVVPAEIAPKLAQRLVGADLWSVYVERYLRLAPHLLATALAGLPWDRRFLAKLRKTYSWLHEGLQAHVDQLVGHRLNVGSPAQMKQWLYDELHVAPCFNGSGQNKTVTADDGALFKTWSRYKRHRPMIEAVIALKKVRTREQGTLGTEIDDDGRIRSAFPMRTETGRLSSEANPRGSGRNLQNIERGSAECEEDEWKTMRNLIASSSWVDE